MRKAISMSILVCAAMLTVSCSQAPSGVATVVASGDIESVLGSKSQNVEVQNGTANSFASAAIACRMNDGSIWRGAVSDVGSGSKQRSMVMASEDGSRATRAVACGFSTVFTAEGPTMDAAPQEFVEEVSNLR